MDASTIVFALDDVTDFLAHEEECRRVVCALANIDSFDNFRVPHQTSHDLLNGQDSFKKLKYVRFRYNKRFQLQMLGRSVSGPLLEDEGAATVRTSGSLGFLLAAAISNVSPCGPTTFGYS